MKIPYTLRLSERAKNMRLTVQVGGRVVVTLPQRFSKSRVVPFIREHAVWIMRAVKRMIKSTPRISRHERAHAYDSHKLSAVRIAEERLHFFNEHYGYRYNRVTIKKQRTRWGSCSKKGNLNFSYRVALIEPRLADYVFVHELCHLRELNHSARFWTLVGQTIPDYKERRKELRKLPL